MEPLPRLQYTLEITRFGTGTRRIESIPEVFSRQLALALIQVRNTHKLSPAGSVGDNGFGVGHVPAKMRDVIPSRASVAAVRIAQIPPIHEIVAILCEEVVVHIKRRMCAPVATPAPTPAPSAAAIENRSDGKSYTKEMTSGATAPGG